MADQPDGGAGQAVPGKGPQDEAPATKAPGAGRPDTVIQPDPQDGELRELTRKEVAEAAGKYATTLPRGSAERAEIERQAMDIARGGPKWQQMKEDSEPLRALVAEDADKAAPSKFAGATHPQPGMSADDLRALAKRQQAAGDPHWVNTVQKANDLEGKPEWRRIADGNAASSRAIGEARTDTSPYRQGPGAPAPQDVEITQRDRMSALGNAREVHFREATGLTIPRAGEFGLVGGRSEYNLAEQQLLSGDHAGGIASLNRALSAERTVRGRKTRAQQNKLANLERFRDQVAEATSHPKDTLSVLARLPGGAPSGMTALDHNGAEYRVNLKDGTVAVTRDGQTVSPPADGDATHTARALAAG